MSTKSDFNMAEEVRKIVKRKPEATSGQVCDALEKKFPKENINRNSASVAVSAARKKLGISKDGTAAKGNKKPAAKKTVTRKAPKMAKTGSSLRESIEQLQRAQQFASEMGGVEEAQAALEGIQELNLT